MQKKEGDESFLKLYWLYFFAGAVALWMSYVLHRYPENGPWHGVFEALFVAALLTLTVDPFVKARVAREVTKDIFYHVIGFRLPEEMQDRLQEYLRGLKYYRVSLDITVRASKTQDGVLLHVIEDGNIKVLTKCQYHQSLNFEEAEQGELVEMYAEQTGLPGKLVEWKSSQLKPPAVQHPEPLTTLYQTPEVKLRKDNTLKSHFKFRIKGRSTDHWVHRYGTTTLVTNVTLIPENGIQMYASGHAHPKPGETLTYNQVFIRGDSIDIRWTATDGSTEKGQKAGSQSQ